MFKRLHAPLSLGYWGQTSLFPLYPSMFRDIHLQGHSCVGMKRSKALEWGGVVT